MNIDQAKEAAAVMLAMADGKPIQYRQSFPPDDAGWIDLLPGAPEIAFDFHNYQYRIKPQPREWWIVQYSSGRMVSYNSPTITSEPGAEIIHVREVLK